EAEDGEVGGEPEPPQDVSRAGQVCARARAVNPQADRKRQDGQRNQPGDLAADLVAEQPQQPGRASESGAGADYRAVTTRRSALAEDAPQPVVAEDEIEHRVVGASANIRAQRGGDRIDDHPTPTG